VFTGSGGTWSQQAKLTAPDGGAYDYFGAAVALSGSTAVAGAYGFPTEVQNGKAYVFVNV
jgi:FG-GAP repeat